MGETSRITPRLLFSPFPSQDGKPVKLEAGKEVTLSTDYNVPGDATTIAVSYKKLAHDLKPGMQILMADGSISLQARAPSGDGKALGQGGSPPFDWSPLPPPTVFFLVSRSTRFCGARS